MIEITLNAGEKFPVAATARYFVVRSVGDKIALSVRNMGDVELQNSDVIDLGIVNDISLVNKSTIAQVIKFQLSPFKIDVGAAKNSIKSIDEVVEVHFDEAFTVGSVTQQGLWDVAVLSAVTNTHKPRVECLAGVATKLFSAGTRKSNRINIRGDQFNGVSLGGSNLVTDASGGFLDVGMVDYMDTSGELWAFNNGASNVYVDVLELV